MLNVMRVVELVVNIKDNVNQNSIGRCIIIQHGKVRDQIIAMEWIGMRRT